MLVKISVGVGRFGQKWTGTTSLQPSAIVDARIIQRNCECGASTRKFRATPVEHTDQAYAALDLPVCFITGGGMGSLRHEADKVRSSLTAWNWSGIIGGHAILNPVMILNGHVREEDLPAAKSGYVWACTYEGSVLSEYVLLPTEQGNQALPIIQLEGECPPCRQKRELRAEQKSFLDRYSEAQRFIAVNAARVAQNFARLGERFAEAESFVSANAERYEALRPQADYEASGTVPFVPFDTEGWLAKSEADAKRFIQIADKTPEGVGGFAKASAEANASAEPSQFVPFDIERLFAECGISAEGNAYADAERSEYERFNAERAERFAADAVRAEADAESVAERRERRAVRRAERDAAIQRFVSANAVDGEREADDIERGFAEAEGVAAMKSLITANAAANAESGAANLEPAEFVAFCLERWLAVEKADAVPEGFGDGAKGVAEAEVFFDRGERLAEAERVAQEDVEFDIESLFVA